MSSSLSHAYHPQKKQRLNLSIERWLLASALSFSLNNASLRFCNLSFGQFSFLLNHYEEEA
jgi:hypothetical protein